MPEIRYIEEFDGTDPAPVNLIPYEISDAQLAQEADDVLCLQYLASSPSTITMPEVWFLLRYLAKQLYINVSQ